MSSVYINHTWIPQGRNVSLTTSKACCCGFVIHCHLLILYGNFITLQGTKVLADREVRFLLCYITEGAPQRQALSSVFKYTGTHGAPQWMDTERGSVFSFNDFVRGTKIKQTSLRHCVIYRQTCPLLRIRQTATAEARCTTRENLMSYYSSASPNSRHRLVGPTP